MSHRLYHTSAFVLRHLPRGEANKLLYLLTPEFGRCLVLARGVRQEKSKLRPNLVDYGYGRFSLVRGREFWRLVSAEKDSRFAQLYVNPARRAVIGRIFSLLAKILSEEEDSQLIFQELEALCQSLTSLTPDTNLIEATEQLFLLRLVKHLGYWPEGTGLGELVETKTWSPDLLKKLTEPKLRLEAVRTINHFFHEHNWLV
ncbi:MAG: recombination protein O N-terminal domain-containing protein [Patescibacteria group bacterium]